ncbi:hypothetical protein SLS63_005832 [Diaporthe eres]|uniref:ER transporter 6TM N-terminal domain-containing protein n=1 Tax=Diaporthe eres TaxID=83184 RepID=A0ABR1P9Q3_DIAER
MSPSIETNEPPGQKQSRTVTPSAHDPVGDSFFVNSTSKTQRRIPQWLDHFNMKDLKILFKTSLAVWITTIFIFIDPTLDFIGQAAFFAGIVLFIVPPSGVVLLQVMAGISICIGIAVGWVWGVITMKASLATRPDEDLQAQYAKLQQSISQGDIQASGPTPAVQVALYDGFFLDTRVSICTFCMIGLFIYLMLIREKARVRVAAPKLTLVSMFSMVIADIYLATAPTIPTFQGTIPKVMILPTVIAIGVGLVCNVLIFPQSTSSLILDSLHDILTPMPGFFVATGQHLLDPSRKLDMKRLEKLKSHTMTAFKDLGTSVAFLPMDISYGRWGADDIGTLYPHFREVVLAFCEFVQLQLTISGSREKNSKLMNALLTLNERTEPGSRLPVAHRQLVKALAMQSAARHPESAPLFTATYSVLARCTIPVFGAWSDAIRTIEEGMSHASGNRAPDFAQSFQDTINMVREQGKEFKDESAKLLLEPHSHLFNDNGDLKNTEDARLLVAFLLGLLYQERILRVNDAFLKLLISLEHVDNHRDRKRLWVPRGLDKLLHWTLAKDETTPTTQKEAEITESDQDDDGQTQSDKAAQGGSEAQNSPTAQASLDNIRSSHGRQRTRASYALLAVINWLTNDEGLHALRTLVVTIGLAIPAVLKTTAGFYYIEKGFWALIMAQMALVPYASDFVSGLLVRVAGTVAGGVVGLVCWYIGAGSGPGNPYGLAAVMAVAIVALMWWRLFAPPDQIQAPIMMASTMYLVVSYSWMDTHSPTYGDPGVGYSVFWRRILLVLVAFGAATVVLFFPRPPSGSRHYRELLSRQIGTVKERYALYLSTWKDAPADLAQVVEAEYFMSQGILEASVPAIEQLKFEFSTSNIDSATLSRQGPKKLMSLQNNQKS